MAWAEGVRFDSQGFLLEVPRWDFPDHGISCIFGASGSGKTTLLQILAGLIPCPTLKLVLGGEMISQLDPRHRNLGFVFQDYGLFPHMTAWENIAFAAQSRNIPGGMWNEQSKILVDRLNLKRILEQKAATLSGGEQQRVALARALITKPRAVLMDEPLSALDDKRKDEARLLIKELNAEFLVPFLLVTHDLRDVRGLSESLLVLNEGNVIGQGPTLELLEHPASLLIAQQFSENQILNTKVIGDKILLSETELPRLKDPRPTSTEEALVIKEWNVSAEVREIKSKHIRTPARLIQVFNGGAFYHCVFELPDGQRLRGTSSKKIGVGTNLDIFIDLTEAELFER